MEDTTQGYLRKVRRERKMSAVQIKVSNQNIMQAKHAKYASILQSRDKKV